MANVAGRLMSRWGGVRTFNSSVCVGRFSDAYVKSLSRCASYTVCFLCVCMSMRGLVSVCSPISSSSSLCVYSVFFAVVNDSQLRRVLLDRSHLLVAAITIMGGGR